MATGNHCNIHRKSGEVQTYGSNPEKSMWTKTHRDRPRPTGMLITVTPSLPW